MIGRQQLVDVLWQHAQEGHTVFLYGPVGIGKTMILDAIAAKAVSEHRPCGRAATTATLGDVTLALASAYPEVDATDLSQRKLRGRLRLALGEQAGVLLLDGLHDTGTAVKGFLRTLRGTGLGVILAGDVEHPRDHARFRALGLAYREIKMPPLAGRHMTRLLDAACGRCPPFRSIGDEDRAALLRTAGGRPGWILAAAQLLVEPGYFDGTRLCIEVLRADLAIATAHKLIG